jgi:hypothetical protein
LKLFSIHFLINDVHERFQKKRKRNHFKKIFLLVLSLNNTRKKSFTTFKKKNTQKKVLPLLLFIILFVLLHPLNRFRIFQGLLKASEPLFLFYLRDAVDQQIEDAVAPDADHEHGLVRVGLGVVALRRVFPDDGDAVDEHLVLRRRAGLLHVGQVLVREDKLSRLPISEADASGAAHGIFLDGAFTDHIS